MGWGEEGKVGGGVAVGGEFQSRLRVNRFPKKVLRIAFLPGTRASHCGVLSCDCNTRMTLQDLNVIPKKWLC